LTSVRVELKVVRDEEEEYHDSSALPDPIPPD
jgi:hypothetical protein